MYTMVLMTALATGGTTPDLFCHHCRSSCHGCYGGCWGSCAGCYGCYGGYGYGCAGYWGSCYGSGWGGACYGGYVGHGGYGCYGAGCYGGAYGGGGVGGVPYAPPYFPSSTIPQGTQPPPAGEQLPAPKENKGSTMSSTRARLIVDLPEDARLYIDDQPMKTASARRTFHTPELDRDQLYYYILKAEVMVDGKPVSETRRVILRAGEVVRANFSDLGAAEAAAAKAKKAQAVAAKTR